MQAVTITQITPPELEVLIENSIKKVLSSQKSEHSTDIEQLLTIKEAAAMVHYTVPYIYCLVSRRCIPFSKRPHSNRLWFSKQDLTNWIKEGRKKTLTEIAASSNTYLKKKGGKNV